MAQPIVAHAHIFSLGEYPISVRNRGYTLIFLIFKEEVSDILRIEESTRTIAMCHYIINQIAKRFKSIVLETVNKFRLHPNIHVVFWLAKLQEIKELCRLQFIQYMGYRVREILEYGSKCS